MGKDHIMISLAWGFLLASPILIQYPVYFIAFIIGVTLGSVYPDIDSSHNPYGNVSSDDLEEGRGALTALMRFVAYPAKHLTGFIVSKGNKASNYSPPLRISSKGIIFPPANFSRASEIFPLFLTTVDMYALILQKLSAP